VGSKSRLERTKGEVKKSKTSKNSRLICSGSPPLPIASFLDEEGQHTGEKTSKCGGKAGLILKQLRGRMRFIFSRPHIRKRTEKARGGEKNDSEGKMSRREGGGKYMMSQVG